jgi:hypothetical protein
VEGSFNCETKSVLEGSIGRMGMTYNEDSPSPPSDAARRMTILYYDTA